ncbi:hypothetical protein C8R44DRAFT_749848 [Mycena epipterygia]|nr:hypothetical protein C8R44DRAFT_749848 [Mycena epipterygia]
MVTVRVARIYAPLIGHAPLFPGRGSSRPDPALALPFPVSATLLRSFRPKRQCCCSQNVRCAGCALWAAGVHAAHRPRGVSFPVPATILRAAPDSSTRAAAPKTFTARCRRSARTFAVRTTGVDAWLIDIPLSFWCPGHFCAPAASTQFGLCDVQARSTVPGASRTAVSPACTGVAHALDEFKERDFADDLLINHKCKKRLYLVSALQNGEGNGEKPSYLVANTKIGASGKAGCSAGNEDTSEPRDGGNEGRFEVKYTILSCLEVLFWGGSSFSNSIKTVRISTV